MAIVAEECSCRVKASTLLRDTVGAYFKSGESRRRQTPILLKSIAIHLPSLMRCFGKVCPPLAESIILFTNNLYRDTAPVVLRYLCRSIRVRGRWNTPNQGLRRLTEKRRFKQSFALSLQGRRRRRAQPASQQSWHAEAVL